MQTSKKILTLIFKIQIVITIKIFNLFGFNSELKFLTKIILFLLHKNNCFSMLISALLLAWSKVHETLKTNLVAEKIKVTPAILPSKFAIYLLHFLSLRFAFILQLNNFRLFSSYLYF